MEPQWETAGQGLVQSVLLPWEQSFYLGAPETVFALKKKQKKGENEHLIRSHRRLLHIFSLLSVMVAHISSHL